MGIEHSFKEDDTEVRRCPGCGVISVIKVEGVEPYVSTFGGDTCEYFVCQNPLCDVERIYTDDVVMVSGRDE